MALVGLRIWVRRVRGGDAEEIAELVSRQLREEIRDEVARALEDRQSEVDELHERLDFAERILTQGRSEGEADKS
jgi:Mg2+ and Co2+ transporter CorA